MALVAEGPLAKQPAVLDPIETWFSLVALSRLESKRLETKPGTRNAAVAIILRFTSQGKHLDVSSLLSDSGLVDDKGIIGNRTRPIMNPPTLRLFWAVYSQLQFIIPPSNITKADSGPIHLHFGKSPPSDPKDAKH
jgi:hypothetical protein